MKKKAKAASFERPYTREKRKNQVVEEITVPEVVEDIPAPESSILPNTCTPSGEHLSLSSITPGRQKVERMCTPLPVITTRELLGLNIGTV